MARIRTIASKRGHDWRESVEYFFFFKQSQGISERTLEDYKRHLKKFFEDIGTNIQDWENLKLSVMRYFADSVSLAPATFNTRRKTLKPFFSWAASEGIIEANPSTRLLVEGIVAAWRIKYIA